MLKVTPLEPNPLMLIWLWFSAATAGQCDGKLCKISHGGLLRPTVSDPGGRQGPVCGHSKSQIRRSN